MKTLAAALLLVGACALLVIIYEPAPASREAVRRVASPVAVSVAWNGPGVGCEAPAEGCMPAALRPVRGR